MLPIGCYMQCRVNVAARLVFSLSARRSELLHDLHWLKLPVRIQFRLCCLYRCLYSIAPSYLAETHLVSNYVVAPFRINIDTTHVDHTTNYTWRSSISSGRMHGPGMLCRRLPELLTRRLRSGHK